MNDNNWINGGKVDYSHFRTASSVVKYLEFMSAYQPSLTVRITSLINL